MNSEKHLFALHFESLTGLINRQSASSTLEVADQDLWQRIVKVLHMKAGEEIIFFDNMHHVVVRLSESMWAKKNVVAGQIISHKQNQELTPIIVLYAPLTKKDAFESIVYSAAQLGVSKIIPFISAKTHRVWWNEKDRARCTKIMIAACEQAKQFIIPELVDPISFAQLVSGEQENIFFEARALEFSDFFARKKSMKNITILFGPEGGLTSIEMEMLMNKGFEKYGLTKTILRSQDAVLLGLGILRSLC